MKLRLDKVTILLILSVISISISLSALALLIVYKAPEEMIVVKEVSAIPEKALLKQKTAKVDQASDIDFDEEMIKEKIDSEISNAVEKLEKHLQKMIAEGLYEKEIVELEDISGLEEVVYRKMDTNLEINETLKRDLYFYADDVVRDNIQALILKYMAREIDKVNWSNVLDQEKLQEILYSANQGDRNYPGESSPVLEKVDLSEIGGADEKVRKILEKIGEANNNEDVRPLVDQIAEIGEEAFPELLRFLDDEKNYSGPARWLNNEKYNAVIDSLKRIFTAEHKDIILKYFEDKGLFADLIKKYMFPEAEKIVLDKIRLKPTVFDSDLVDIAVMMNEEKAYPLLKEYALELKNNNNAAYILEKINSMANADINDLLLIKYKNAQTTWERRELFPLLMENGMKEGVDTAIELLNDESIKKTSYLQSISETIRKYTNARGNAEEMAAWLERNRNILEWNTESGRFE